MRFFVLVSVCLLSCDAYAQVSETQESKVVDGPVIAWESSSFDFGDIGRGEVVEHTFTFTNTGNSSLIITNVLVTCGCTTPKGWPREPVAAGASKEIVVAFDSTGKFGRQNKVITIVSNAVNKERQILFTANIIDKKELD